MTLIKLVYVNSYLGSGIGDFGKHIYDELHANKSIQIRYLETGENWADLLRIWRSILFTKENVILNVGFTSFGKSPFKNYMNFLLIFIRQKILHKNILIILHDSPDILDKKTAGYRFFSVLKIGGMLATRLIKYSAIVVFSDKLKDVLVNRYHGCMIHYFPLPCTIDPEHINAFKSNSSKIKIVNIGYIAPYKGLELLPSIKKELMLLGINDAEFVVIGKPHRVLYKTVNGKKYIENLFTMLNGANIQLTGYMATDKIDQMLKNNRCIAILPYRSVYGSSSSAIFFIERGIPVVAPDLHDFSKFKELGAGLVITKNNPAEFAMALKKLVVNENELNLMAEQDLEYCKKYNLKNFTDELLKIL